MEKKAKDGAKTKTVVQLESPYTKVEWPTISAQDEATILMLLTELLTPIGLHRAHYTTPSKGKRSRKRKRSEPATSPLPLPVPKPTPSPPEITKYLTTGLNATTRHLSLLSSRTLHPSSSPAPLPLSTIFLPQTPNHHLLHAHIPLASLAASAHLPAHQKTRLVPLSPAAEATLAKALCIPRVGMLGILEGAPGAAGLVECVRERVDVVKCRWMDQAIGAVYKPVNIGVEEKEVRAVVGGKARAVAGSGKGQKAPKMGKANKVEDARRRGGEKRAECGVDVVMAGG